MVALLYVFLVYVGLPLGVGLAVGRLVPAAALAALLAALLIAATDPAGTWLAIPLYALWYAGVAAGGAALRREPVGSARRR